eukprot:TRINITY_DN3128_c0_g1_i4.p1 TRINITY_DN3128_c0_g1~~TRINITY_DN3128_c0_g1_i4.p1  ORF type:complete len:311 (+),score=70.15 TRINITY_DN3128_c0_g1_i4:100-1032(+)
MRSATTQFKLICAPLEGYSERSFRKLCYQYGATLTMTEMSHVDSLSRGNKSSWRRVEIDTAVPTAIQLLAGNENQLQKTLDLYRRGDHPLPTEWNFNLGCPSPEVIKKGLGCSMVKRIAKNNSLVNLIRKEFGGVVSVKLRLGLNAFEKRNKVYLNLIKECDADYFIVHARDGQQTSKDPPDWEIYDECVNTGKPIIANGNIRTLQDLEKLKGMGVQGVCIGRAAVQNPLIFTHFRKHLENFTPQIPQIDSQQPQLIIDQVKKQYFNNMAYYYGSEFRDNEKVVEYINNFERHFGDLKKYTDLDFDFDGG